ncbi:exo-beta-N-acetylmuramidase NamZ domain-containing protein [Paenibacillus sp. GCM10027626]|uniref:exo-beta-N-acetylmuramidase NamZ family protein n=1 Tax=Paenibacillus sp. GCM10027626 TaxID=3273411 RepID=UPI0036339EBF
MLRNGIDNIGRWAHLLQGKRIGLITSPTGLAADFRTTIDILHERFGLAALFSPEHGVRGDQAAGALVDTYTDPLTGVPVYSLYRRDSKRLTAEMLDAVDLIVYDIQDVGARYYTFIYTMLYALEDCAKAGKPFVVLDRINPLDGVRVEGNVLKAGFESFVGNYPLAVRYGLTAGEVAVMANEECGWKADLHVVRCEGWSRSMTFADTGRAWIPPSMGIPRFHTALLYPGTCLFEGTNLSEGRGTTAPFEIVGAPFVDGERLAAEMNGKRLPGVHFRSVYFKPTFSKHEGELCGGVYAHVLDERTLRPVELGVELLFAARKLFPEFAFLPPVRENGRPFIDLLCGERAFRGEQVDVPALLARFEAESAAFAERKRAFHLYN